MTQRCQCSSPVLKIEGDTLSAERMNGTIPPPPNRCEKLNKTEPQVELTGQSLTCRPSGSGSRLAFRGSATTDNPDPDPDPVPQP